MATLLALAGGYIDAYTWITHHVFANAQTANMMFLWIHATAREWAKAFHYVPFLTAFMLGVIMASGCAISPANRPAIGSDRNRASVAVGILHNRLPTSPEHWHFLCRRNAGC